MPKYILKPGYKHNQGTDDEIEPGDVIEMTVEQASGFLDKFELVAGEKAPKAEPKGKASDDLDSLTVAELKALPEWDLIPEPRPTIKSKIVKALREARGE